MRSTRHLKNHSMGRNERVTYSRPSRTRARPLLAPVVRSCPRGAPTRPLLVPARFSYSSATPTRPLLVPGGCSLPLRGEVRARPLPLRGEVRARPLPLRGEVRAPPGHGHYPGCDPGLPLCCSCPYPSMCSCPLLPLTGRRWFWVLRSRFASPRASRWSARPVR